MPLTPGFPDVEVRSYSRLEDFCDRCCDDMMIVCEET